MSIRNKPNYGLYSINLTTAGFLDLPIVGTRVIMAAAYSNVTFATVAGVNVVSGGTPAPSTIVNVQIGRALGDPVPFGINTKINVDDAFEFVRLSWAAQANVTAFFVIDDDREGAGVSLDAPSPVLGGTVSILGGTAIVQGGNTATVDANGDLHVAAKEGFRAPQDNRSFGGCGASFANGAGTGALITLISPATNVNGVILRFAYLANGTNGGSLYADTAAPANANDSTKRQLMCPNNSSAQSQTIRDMYLPAGIGLYHISGGASCSYCVGWDVL